MRCTSSSHTGSKLTSSTGAVVLLCNVVFLQSDAQTARDSRAVSVVTSCLCIYPSIRSHFWTERQHTIFYMVHLFPKWHLRQWQSQSIYMLETCSRATSEDDSLMSSVTANLVVWEWEGAARVFISLRKNQHIWSRVGGRVIFQSEFSSSPRVTSVRGCTRSLPPIFTGCLAKLRLVTEVMLLLNACIPQLLASNLTKLGWVYARNKDTVRNTESWSSNIKALTMFSVLLCFDTSNCCAVCFSCWHMLLKKICFFEWKCLHISKGRVFAWSALAVLGKKKQKSKSFC